MGLSILLFAVVPLPGRRLISSLPWAVKPGQEAFHDGQDRFPELPGASKSPVLAAGNYPTQFVISDSSIRRG